MVSRTFKIIEMKEKEEQRLWELGSKAEPKQEDEEVQYTFCCGNEITGDVEDIGLCPTCLEHI